jgi:hypothetical protein
MSTEKKLAKTNIRDKHSVFIFDLLEKAGKMKIKPKSDAENQVALFIAEQMLSNKFTQEYEESDLKALIKDLFIEWRGEGEIGIQVFYTPGVQRVITGLSAPKITVSLFFGFNTKTQSEYDKVLAKKQKSSSQNQLTEA